MSSNTSTQDLWHADKAAVILEPMGDDTLCYNRRSGGTHLLNVFPAEVLKRVLEEPGTGEQLARRLATDFELPCDADWLHKVAVVLNDLRNISLVDSSAS